MSKTVNLSIRMDAGLKQEAEELFTYLGMNFTTAINLFVRQSVRRQRIPFDLTRDVPNSETLEAVAEAVRIAEDPNVKGYDSVDEFLKHLKS